MRSTAIASFVLILVAALLPAADVAFRPEQLVTFNHAVYFIAHDALGTGLWKTDGTSKGTARVVRLIRIQTRGQISGLTKVGESLFFFVHVDAGGVLELWRSDGTAQGTARIKSWGLTPGEKPSRIAVGNILFFSFSDGIHGNELWRSDGTQSGTRLIKDLWPGPGDSFPQNLAPLQGRLVFSAMTADLVREIFVTDGTSSGTRQLTRLGAGVKVTEMTPFNSFAFFVLNDNYEYHGSLWSTDGKATGATLITDSYSSIGELTVFDNALYFVGAGADGGPRLVRMDANRRLSIIHEDPGSGTLFPHALRAIPSYLLFMDENEGKSNALWRTSGTKEGTAVVRGIGGWEFEVLRPSSDSSGFVLMNLGNPYQFPRLWVTNGAREKTYPLSSGLGQEVDPNRPAGAEAVAILKGDFIFSATRWTADGKYEAGGHLWRSDGTIKGTHILH